jgi:hypothetical protein
LREEAPKLLRTDRKIGTEITARHGLALEPPVNPGIEKQKAALEGGFA